LNLKLHINESKVIKVVCLFIEITPRLLLMSITFWLESITEAIHVLASLFKKEQRFFNLSRF